MTAPFTPCPATVAAIVEWLETHITAVDTGNKIRGITEQQHYLCARQISKAIAAGEPFEKGQDDD